MVFEDIKNNVLPIVAGLVVLIVIGILIAPLLKSTDSIKKKITPADITYDDTYAFKADKIIVNKVDSGCTVKKEINGFIKEIQCNKDSKQNFDTIIINNAQVMRTYQGGVVVCEYGDENCCEGSGTMTISTDECIIKPGESSECSAGIHRFDDYKYGNKATKYEVHPLANCPMVETTGCYKPGITSSIKYCNKAESIIVTLI